MKAISELKDERIDSTNYLFEISVKEFLDISKDIIKENEFQRRRVKASKTIYSLLKSDLQKGCLIPPIVLALTHTGGEECPPLDKMNDFILKYKSNLVILDGLQRTHTLIDLEKDLSDAQDEQTLATIYKRKLRVEIFIGINRLGILYRMLTLNTGQTPMSLRQQVEILYLDYSKMDIPGIKLFREADERTASGPGQYNFKDIMEGFNSYLERNELPIGRADLLANIKSLEKLAKENSSNDIFRQYLEAWNKLIENINNLMANARLSKEDSEEFGTPFGKTADQIFKKPQVISGFGAAVGKLMDYKLIKDFGDIEGFANNLSLHADEEDDEPEAFLKAINSRLDWIKNNSKKIGNAQRVYFQYYFRDLFNREADSFGNLYESVESAYQKYVSQNT